MLGTVTAPSRVPVRVVSEPELDLEVRCDGFAAVHHGGVQDDRVTDECLRYHRTGAGQLELEEGRDQIWVVQDLDRDAYLVVVLGSFHQCVLLIDHDGYVVIAMQRVLPGHEGRCGQAAADRRQGEVADQDLQSVEDVVEADHRGLVHVVPVVRDVRADRYRGVGHRDRRVQGYLTGQYAQVRHALDRNDGLVPVMGASQLGYGPERVHGHVERVVADRVCRGPQHRYVRMSARCDGGDGLVCDHRGGGHVPEAYQNVIGGHQSGVRHVGGEAHRDAPGRAVDRCPEWRVQFRQRAGYDDARHDVVPGDVVVDYTNCTDVDGTAISAAALVRLTLEPVGGVHPVVTEMGLCGRSYCIRQQPEGGIPVRACPGRRILHPVGPSVQFDIGIRYGVDPGPVHHGDLEPLVVPGECLVLQCHSWHGHTGQYRGRMPSKTVYAGLEGDIGGRQVPVRC